MTTRFPRGDGGDVVAFGAGNIATTTVTRYMYPWFEDTLAMSSPAQWRTPRAGTFQNMRVRQNLPAGNGNAVVYTLRINGVPSTLTVSMASTASDGSDLVNTVAVVAGDLIDVEVTKAASIGSAVNDIICVTEFV